MFKYIRSYFQKVVLTEELQNRNEKILLHIGDIEYFGFPYIKKLIRTIKPDIIVHTGDFVDNLKVGRKPEDIPAYQKKAKLLLHFIESNTKDVYIVPGNNDLIDYIKEQTTKAHIIQPNTCLEICGLSFLLSHRVLDINGEAKFYLYGHGPTGDTHKFEDNGKDGKYYSNVFFGPSVLFLESQKLLRINNYKGAHKK